LQDCQHALLQVAVSKSVSLLLLLQVSLVLEYCDWGSLRTALDAGAFFAGESMQRFWQRSAAACN
jgi:hypothetical protein